MFIMCLLTLCHYPCSQCLFCLVLLYWSDLTGKHFKPSLLCPCAFYVFLVQISTILILHHHFIHVFSLICGIYQLAFMAFTLFLSDYMVAFFHFLNITFMDAIRASLACNCLTTSSVFYYNSSIFHMFPYTLGDD